MAPQVYFASTPTFSSATPLRQVKKPDIFTIVCLQTHLILALERVAVLLLDYQVDAWRWRTGLVAIRTFFSNNVCAAQLMFMMDNKPIFGPTHDDWLDIYSQFMSFIFFVYNDS